MDEEKKGRTVNNPLTVEELNNFIGEFFKINHYFNNIYIKGEISSIDIQRKIFAGVDRSYAYLTLKNGDKSKISCMIWSESLKEILKIYDIKKDLQIGKEIVVLGSINAYPKGGTYNFTIKEIAKVDGITGDSLKKERLKKALELEGAFTRKRKEIVKFPRSVAIIAAKDKAAIADVVEGINKRFPLVKINCYYPAMQGENAILEIPEKIKLANYNNEDDFIIICRGGGDLNDLKVFDDEKIVRAIIASNLPVITAIGHEINISLSDLVSDKSYKTPTAAAEGCFPDLSQILKDITEFKKIITKDYNSIIIKNKNQRLEIHQRLLKLQPIFKYKEIITNNETRLLYGIENLKKSYKQYLKNLLEIISKNETKLSYATENLKRSYNQYLRNSLEMILKNETKLLHIVENLKISYRHCLKNLFEIATKNETKLLYMVENLNKNYRQYLKDLSEVAHRKLELAKIGINNFLLNKVNESKNLSLKLELKNPKTILEMGYAKVFNKLNDVRSVDDVSIGDDIKTLLSDGEIISKVISKKENTK